MQSGGGGGTAGLVTGLDGSTRGYVLTAGVAGVGVGVDGGARSTGVAWWRNARAGVPVGMCPG